MFKQNSRLARLDTLLYIFAALTLFQVSPLQQMEVGKLRKRITDFEHKQSDFRKNFQKMRFYFFKCRKPYELLAEANELINQNEAEMKALQV